MARSARRPVVMDYLDGTAADLGAEFPSADDAPELARELTRALAGLRPEYRTAFVLFHEGGQSYDAIAAVLKRPVGTVKTWLHRARLELLDALRRRGMVDPESTPDLRMNKID